LNGSHISLAGGLTMQQIGGVSTQDFVLGAVAGAWGAVAGTLGGYAARVRTARAVGRDWPIALLEDLVAISCAILIVIISTL
jgi:uncharacterized membrane protein